MGAHTVKHLPAVQETRVLSLGQEDPLEEGMATPSSTLAWRSPRREEPGGLQSMGHKELDMTELLTHTHTHTHTTVHTVGGISHDVNPSPPIYMEASLSFSASIEPRV